MREYLLTILVTAAATYLLVPPVRVLAIKIGAAPPVRDRDVHTAPIPLLGGLAMFGGMAIGLIVASRLPHLSIEVFDRTPELVPALLLSSALMVFTGFIDDHWGMGPAVKFAGQVGAGAILIYYNVAITWVPLPGGGVAALPPEYSFLITILLVVTMINSVNFVDGLDGLAAGIVGIAGLAMLTYGYALLAAIENTRLLPALVISAVLIGMCLGFLPHNFHPARIFMGDTGAMLLGLVLASTVITLTDIDHNLIKASVNRFPVVLPLVLPVAAMLVPLADLTLAFFRRTWAGNSPFHPDRKHLHHRLLEIGHSHRRTVLILYLWAFVFASAIVIMSINRSPLFALVLVVVLAAGVLAIMARPHWLSLSRRSQETPHDRHPA